METLAMMHVQKKKHRVHSLTGRITAETLRKAFKNVKKNRGAAQAYVKVVSRVGSPHGLFFIGDSMAPENTVQLRLVSTWHRIVIA